MKSTIIASPGSTIKRRVNVETPHRYLDWLDGRNFFAVAAIMEHTSPFDWDI